MTADQMLAVRLDADKDAEWFRRHPGRNFRVRIATQSEIEMERRAHDMEPIPAGFHVYAAIWQMEPHSRATALMLGSSTNKPDGADEEKAKALFALAVSGKRTFH